MAGSPKLARILLDAGAVQLRPQRPFTFASGIRSPIYCDHRVLLSNVDGRQKVVQALSKTVKKLHPIQLAATATAGIPWGAWVADRLKIPFGYVRSEAKAHGKGRQVEGNLKPKTETILIEDLVSTGGSSLAAVEALRRESMSVSAVVCIFTYEFGECLRAFGNAKVDLVSLTSLNALLNVATRSRKISKKNAEIVVSWRDKH